MAEKTGQADQLALNTPEQVLLAGGVSKRRRNLSNKAGERLRNPHSKSPKRRAGTPEPERRAYTDESEKDVSDTENLFKKNESGKSEEKKYTPGRSRVLVKSKDHGETIRRTRSTERPPKRDTTTEIEDDFEIIRSLHKQTKEWEEEAELKKEQTPKVIKEEEKKEIVQKEMPPLIVAPTELRKRPRPKTLTLPITEEDKPKTTPRSKSKTRMTKRKVSTSEEEEDLVGALAVKGKLTLKPKSATKEEPVKAEPRRKKLIRKVKKDDKKDVSESEGPLTEPEEIEKPEEEEPEKAEVTEEPKSWFQRWFSWGKKPEETEPKQEEEKEPEEEVKEEKEPEIEKPVEEIPVEEVEVEEEEEEPSEELPEEEKKPEPEPQGFFITAVFTEWRTFVQVNSDEYDRIMCLKNKCFSSLLIMLIFCGFGGMIFRFTEGAFESFYKCGVKRVKRDFIDTLWSNSQYMLEDDWKSQARRKLMEFENQLHTAHEAGMTTYSGQKSWSFLNAVVYCLTVVTTIGYGHISPSTATGRAITIIYAIFGIPMFLILLADFGKLFTRCIKFVWAFVRRLYYTGSCRKVRKTAPVQEMMKGMQIVYDYAKNRRPSQMATTDEDEQQQTQLKPPELHPDTPQTPVISTFEIDDEFNLPISVAITILLIYIFVGATIYWTWEEWTFFESFYFVFISMSTIGFGDFVPQHPMYMMASIVYLIFGLALTSMCINVVQEKLTDTFRQASVKIGTTIGLKVEDDGSVSAPAELASVNPIDEISK